RLQRRRRACGYRQVGCKNRRRKRAGATGNEGERLHANGSGRMYAAGGGTRRRKTYDYAGIGTESGAPRYTARPSDEPPPQPMNAELFSATILLVLVIDPFGNVPVVV